MFKLSIECTKDIDSLSIVFSDGKVASVTGSEPEPYDRDPILKPANRTKVAKAVVPKPAVPETDDRRVKVADNLQNLDI